jgi:transketolase
MRNVDKELVKTLEIKAIEVRKLICEMTFKIGNSHLGGELSMTDYVVALYYHFLKFDPKNPKWDDRDRFVLSKGHGGGCMYNILADVGFYDRNLVLTGYNKIDGKFGQHPNRKYIPGIEASTGSLGHGMSLAVGMALAGRYKKKNYRVFSVSGDGELQEGSNWEAIMAAGHYELGNYVHFVDRNRLQINGNTEKIMRLDPLDKKFEAFNWEVHIIDGNNMEEIVGMLSSLPESNSQTPRKPICIIGNTVKGKGVDFMENQAKWHLGGIDDETLQKCYDSIERARR